MPGPGSRAGVHRADGKEEFRQTVYDFECSGVLQGQYNKDSSIASFARSCFQYAIDTKQDLWFATKDTISKQYDHTFKDIFQPSSTPSIRPPSTPWASSTFIRSSTTRWRG